jgi:imidazolonepropionase
MPVRGRHAKAFAQGASTVDCEGRWITPGLIGYTIWSMQATAPTNSRCAGGATHEEVARAGGGIVSSVKALRAASEAELVAQSLPRLDAMIAEGVTTIEIKSGYGLDLENETNLMRAPGGWATCDR